ncbi:MAG: TlpA family protein disulfide reductase, partial [Actinobacteria bacterium]|nr:TlpA family protein disulfide reductase [Actinomycetota bacterium]
MKRFVLVFLIPVLVACSNGGAISSNEQSFIAGNGVATFIPQADRKPAPAVSGPTLDGKNFTAESGKVLVLNVWASWCSPCRAEAPALEELSTSHPEVQFLGVLTRDSLVAARAFVNRFGITYPSLTDDAILLKFHGQLTPNAIPTTLIIDSKGKIAARISGEITYSALEDLIKRV